MECNVPARGITHFWCIMLLRKRRTRPVAAVGDRPCPSTDFSQKCAQTLQGQSWNCKCFCLNEVSAWLACDDGVGQRSARCGWWRCGGRGGGRRPSAARLCGVNFAAIFAAAKRTPLTNKREALRGGFRSLTVLNSLNWFSVKKGRLKGASLGSNSFPVKCAAVFFTTKSETF